MTFTKTITTVILATALSTGAVFAKGHDQSDGVDMEPGANTGAETVSTAQALGAIKGNGEDKSGKVRGNSADAGKPAKD
jgi:hypothetical protein|tara:strand:+ start:75951 stop:76187 length:237 start_codon:yes stop_codon:yes gene_type:complete